MHALQFGAVLANSSQIGRTMNESKKMDCRHISEIEIAKVMFMYLDFQSLIKFEPVCEKHMFTIPISSMSIFAHCNVSNSKFCH